MLLHVIISLYLAAVSMAEDVTRFERESGTYPKTPDATVLAPSKTTCAKRCTSVNDWCCGGFRHLPDGTCQLYKQSSLNAAGSSRDSATEKATICRRKICPDPDQCTCPEGFQRRAGHCLYWRETRMNYTDAEAECANRGGLLFAPRNDRETQAVTDVAGGYYSWLGYRTRRAENLTISSDGRPATYTNWGSDEPNMEEDGYVISIHGWWYDDPCDFHRHPLCYLPQYYRPCCSDEQ